MAPPKGFRHTPEALAKIAAASRARTFSAETVEKRAAKWRGRKLTPDQVARLSAAKKGKPQSSTQIAGIRRWLDTPRFKALNVGRKLTVEHCAKIAASNTGRPATTTGPLSLEHRAKVSAGLKGKPKTAAHRAATAEAARTSPKAIAHRAQIYLSNPSSIELTVRSLLDALNVVYVPQKPIGRYVVDVFVPSRNLVIECDGTYWHRNRGEQDSKRDAHMTSLGLRVLRLPEPDIRSGAYAHAVKRILGMAM